MRTTVLVVALCLVGCATSSQNTAPQSRWPPRIQPLEEVLANAESFPCVAGLHAVPASVVEVGVFANVPYSSFSNGNVEVNVYGDPANPVGLEAGSQNQDATLQQCLIQFVGAQTLNDADRQRVLRFTPAPGVDNQSGLQIEVTPPNGPDAYGAWWISLERNEAIAESRLPPEQVAQLSQPATQWQAPPPTYYRRPARPHVVYRPYRPAAVRVYPPRFHRSSGVYIRIR